MEENLTNGGVPVVHAPTPMAGNARPLTPGMAPTSDSCTWRPRGSSLNRCGMIPQPLGATRELPGRDRWRPFAGACDPATRHGPGHKTTGLRLRILWRSADKATCW